MAIVLRSLLQLFLLKCSGQQIYWVLYSLLTLESLRHKHINWMHYIWRESTSQCSRINYFYSFNICCHTQEMKQKKIKQMVFPRIPWDTTFKKYSSFRLLFEEVLDTLFLCMMLWRFFQKKYLIKFKVSFCWILNYQNPCNRSPVLHSVE